MENLGVSPLLGLNDLEDESVLGCKHSCDIEAKKEKRNKKYEVGCRNVAEIV